jgi:hypothetical protein
LLGQTRPSFGQIRSAANSRRCKVNDGNLIWGFEAAFHWMRSSAVLLLFSLFARAFVYYEEYARVCFVDLFCSSSSASLACNSIYLTSHKHSPIRRPI